MSAQPARTLAPVPTGNMFDKYGSRNPVVRRLMAGFEHALAGLMRQADPVSVLDLGCGEGILTLRWAQELGERPVQSLAGGAGGIQVIERLARESPAWLRRGGFLVVEIGSEQGMEVSALLSDRFEDVRVLPDLAGRDRVVAGRVR